MSKKKGFMGMKEGSWAEGLAKLHHKGGWIEPVRITKRGKEILLEMIKDDKSNTSITFDDDEAGLGYFMEAMTWLEYQITGKRPPYTVRLSKRIAWTLHIWIADNRYYHLAGEPDFDKAMQWITNKYNKKYAPFQMTNFDRK